MLIQLTDKNFDDTLVSSEPLFVMFEAQWAGPCNMVRESYENLAKRRGNEIYFGAFDIDDNHIIPSRYNVRSLPCFMLFMGGKPVKVVAGAVEDDVLSDMCDF